MLGLDMLSRAGEGVWDRAANCAIMRGDVSFRCGSDSSAPTFVALAKVMSNPGVDGAVETADAIRGAAGGAPGQHAGATGPIGGAPDHGSACGEQGRQSTMQELSELRALPSWATLVDVVRSNLVGNPRQALSHNVTTACRPGKQPGPAGSLHACGLDYRRKGNEGVFVELRIPNSFQVGDGIEIHYVSGQWRTLKEAQRDACETLLCFPVSYTHLTLPTIYSV